MHKLTIYVDITGGRYEARYWDRDEGRYWRYVDYDVETAIRKAVKSTGYTRSEIKVVNVL